MNSFGLLSVRRWRAALASTVALGALALGGCKVDGPYSVAKHMRPLSSEMVALMEKKGMTKTSPLLIRVFKEEAELEIWKQDSSGHYALLKTYPICRWSGQLGPKTREGDRQAPEGFYAIRPGQMNPNSSFYLSFDLGYPNAFDRAYGRTGGNLMVHGDCSSRGCYSMTDEQIAEIFALGRETFYAGQKSFQVQAYPFRMTALNMARHRNSPHMTFWKNLKEGYDHFDVTRQEPKVDVCEKRYVFNAQAKPGAATPLAFKAAEKCPSYEVDPQIASAVTEKTNADTRAFTEFVQRNTPTVAVNTGRDGGMHKSFMALYETREVRDAGGRVRGVEVIKRSSPLGFAGGSDSNSPIPQSAPLLASSGEPLSSGPTAGPIVAVTGGTPADVPMPRAVPGRPRSLVASTPAPSSASAYSAPGAIGGGNILTGAWDRTTNSVSKLFGRKSEEPTPPVAQRPVRTRPQIANRPKPATPARKTTEQAHAAPKPRAQQAAAEPAPAPAQSAPRRPAAASSLMSGAQQTVPSNSFENRWNAVR